jgi:hypothetical protein
VKEMLALSKKEILTELKKLGINTSPELKSCLKEYKIYYTLQNHHILSPKKYILQNISHRNGM